MDLTAISDLITQHPGALWALAGASAVLFVGSLLLIPWLVARIPADYFLSERRGRPVVLAHRPVLRLVLKLFGNLLGLILIVAGLAMLVLPGQGLLTIIIGLLLVSFPGKYRFERWVVKQPRIRRMIDRLRRRARRPPLLFPDDAGDNG